MRKLWTKKGMVINMNIKEKELYENRKILQKMIKELSIIENMQFKLDIEKNLEHLNTGSFAWGWGTNNDECEGIRNTLEREKRLYKMHKEEGMKEKKENNIKIIEKYYDEMLKLVEKVKEYDRHVKNNILIPKNIQKAYSDLEYAVLIDECGIREAIDTGIKEFYKKLKIEVEKYIKQTK